MNDASVSGFSDSSMKDTPILYMFQWEKIKKIEYFLELFLVDFQGNEATSKTNNTG